MAHELQAPPAQNQVLFKMRSHKQSNKHHHTQTTLLFSPACLTVGAEWLTLIFPQEPVIYNNLSNTKSLAGVLSLWRKITAPEHTAVTHRTEVQDTYKTE